MHSSGATPQQLSALTREMEAARVLFCAFSGERSSPDRLIKSLAASKPRVAITKAELLEIALVKLAGSQGKSVTAANVARNDPDQVLKASAEAFAATQADAAARSLITLNGVRIPVASAVLAWCFPERYPVLDRHSWNTLALFGVLEVRGSKPFTAEDYGTHVSLVRALANEVKRTPQAVDRWLFAFSKCGLFPGSSFR